MRASVKEELKKVEAEFLERAEEFGRGNQDRFFRTTATLATIQREFGLVKEHSTGKQTDNGELFINAKKIIGSLRELRRESRDVLGQINQFSKINIQFSIDGPAVLGGLSISVKEPPSVEASMLLSQSPASEKGSDDLLGLERESSPPLKTPTGAGRALKLYSSFMEGQSRTPLFVNHEKRASNYKSIVALPNFNSLGGQQRSPILAPEPRFVSPPNEPPLENGLPAEQDTFSRRASKWQQHPLLGRVSSSLFSSKKLLELRQNENPRQENQKPDPQIDLEKDIFDDDPAQTELPALPTPPKPRTKSQNNIPRPSEKTVTICNLTIDSTKFRKVIYSYIHSAQKVTRFNFKRNTFLVDPIHLLLEIFGRPVATPYTVDLSDNRFIGGEPVEGPDTSLLKSKNVFVVL